MTLNETESLTFGGNPRLLGFTQQGRCQTQRFQPNSGLTMESTPFTLIEPRLMASWPLYLLASALTVVALMAAIWLWSLKRRDVSMVDAFWAPGFAVILWTLLILTRNITPFTLLLVFLTSFWAIRLGFYLAGRWLAHGEEDRRYAAMRAHHAGRFGRVSLYTVFGLQAALMWLIALPLQLALLTVPSPPLGLFGILGTALFLLGFALEAAADAQLHAFKANPENEGKVMDRGLWGWSRHPNYFGNAMLWWGLFLLAAETEAARWAFFAPVLMTFLLLRVSGVRLLEKTIAKRRPDYEDYKTRVNAFVPLPPGWRKRHKISNADKRST